MLQRYDERLGAWIARWTGADAVTKQLCGYAVKLGIEWSFMGALMAGITAATLALHSAPVVDVPGVPDAAGVLWLALTGISGASAQCDIL